MTLSELPVGETSVITKIRGRGAFRKRIIEMGFVVGMEVTAVKKAPLQDPIVYRVLGSDVSLRKSESDLIEIVSEEDVVELYGGDFGGVVDTKVLKETAVKKEKIIEVVLVGNPNCGKTTIFNIASHSRERVGNYGGVTVESKTGVYKFGEYTIKLVDLPGTYSLSTYSPEELYVRDYIIEHAPDIVLNVVDTSHLERNLYLTTQLIDMDVKVVAALNMFDEFEKEGDKFDYEALGKMIGIPFVPTVGSKEKGVNELFERVIEVYEGKDSSVRSVHVNYGVAVERAVANLQEIIFRSKARIANRISTRFLALKLLEGDQDICRAFEECDFGDELQTTAGKERERLLTDFKEDVETILAEARYGFIAGALQETLKANPIKRIGKSERIDSVLTHRILGLPIFALFMWTTFYLTFEVGKYPMNWLEAGVGTLSSFLSGVLPAGVARDFFIDGVIGGAGGVLVFLPNIVLLYFFISLMEDTGYMARAVFIMDAAMHKMGLHGKSFIPLLMGFGCNVPAILSSRIIENRKDRLVTMLINPFMSCSARLPVYVLFISAFFTEYRGLILFLLYLTGILLAFLSALLFKKTLFRSEESPFVMELPPYRVPTLKSIVRHMWYRASHYLKKIGGVILAASIIIWALGYFPRNIEYSKNYDTKILENENRFLQASASGDFSENELKKLKNEIEDKNNELELEREAERQSKSYIGRLGRAVLPALEPLGFDWKMSVSVLTGIAAKEIVVGTLGVLYQADDPEGEASIVEKIKEQEYRIGSRSGEKVFTPVVALSFMAFILIYFPCVGVLSAIRKESGSIKWALFSMAYTTTLAWIAAFLVYRIGSLIA